VRIAILLALSIPYSMPFIWMVLTSLKTDTQIFPTEGGSISLMSWENFWPNPFDFENYPDTLESVPFLLYTKNSMLVSFFSVVGAVASSAVVAYGFARMQFKWKEPLFLLVLATMALPTQVTMIPQFILFKWLGWHGTFLPLIVPFFFGVPFFIFLMRQFFRTFPEEIFEAARIDGASEWKIFITIVLPLSKPVLATCALFQLMHSWNDFLGPLLYLNNPEDYTLAYGLQQFVSAYGGEWAQLMAASTMFTLPVVLLFFVIQKTFIQGIATTGGKN